MRVDQGPILLVEDDAMDEALTCRALRKAQVEHTVVVARDGAEALDVVFARGNHASRAGDPLPALILLDLKLPKLDGIEVLRQLRADERTSLLPVVVLTSSNEERDRLACYQAGASSFVQKPVESVRFSDAIRLAAQYWLELNQPAPSATRS